MMYLAIFLASLAVLAVLAIGLRLAEDMENENRLAEASLSSSRLYSEALHERAQAARRFRHDADGLVRAIEHELAQADGDGAHRPRLTAAQAGQDALTGLPLADAIIHLKQERCREAGIDFQADVARLDGLPGMGIPEGELGVLLQNLLDNAIEANERVKDPAARLVRLSVGVGDAGLRIAVENRTESSTRPSFITRKANPELHGIGTRVIDDVVAAHGGAKHVEFDPAARRLRITVTLWHLSRGQSL